MPEAPFTVQQLLARLEMAERRAASSLTLVPSENRLSTFARVPFLLDSYNRYFFNTELDDDSWLFPGGIDYGSFEVEVTLPLAREMLDAFYVNTRPLSGLSAMLLALGALSGGVGGSVFHLHENHGGHYATESVIRRLGLTPIAMTGSTPHTVDLDRLSCEIRAEKPRVLYVDQANALFPLRIDDICRAARDASPEVIIHVDISHWLGLILGGQMQNPLDLGADSIGGSTHKSFPGPQKGLIATRRDDLARQVADTQYYLISSHHFAAAISLGLALWEFREHQGARYASEVIANARRLGIALSGRGFRVHGESMGYTNTHQLWVQAEPLGVDTSIAAARLNGDGIRVNHLPELPGVPEPALRLGLSEVTRRGLSTNDMPALADAMLESVTLHPARRGNVDGLISRCSEPYAAEMTDRELFRFLSGVGLAGTQT